MPTGLKRIHQPGDTHFVTFSCFRRKPLLGTPELRDCFQAILLETIKKYKARPEGWIIMPEHAHLLLYPEQEDTTSAIIQVIKQRYSRALKKIDPRLYQKIQTETAHPPPMPVWETRSYDFNIRNPETFTEKLRYIHRNPIRRELVTRPEDWKWSSFHMYLEQSKRRYTPE